MATATRKPGTGRTTKTLSAPRILDAAERLFADFGYNGVSIRDIAKAADANLSSVYYHFSSKRELLNEVCRRRMQPIVDRRVADMQAAMRETRAGRGNIVDIVAAFIDSSIRMSLGGSAEAKRFRRLVGHLGIDPTPEVRAAIGAIYNDSVQTFIAAVRRAFPQAPPDALFWAAACSLGATLYTQGDMTRLQTMFDRRSPPDDAAAAVRRIARFIAGGLSAATRD
ncbi:MAG: TetR/AcrR family transcriptional regulator [Alphaproteobacteria bacterium]